MMRSKRLLAAALAAVFALGLVACEVDDNGVGDPGTDPGIDDGLGDDFDDDLAE